MPAKSKHQGRIGTLIREVEDVAKKLRAELRKRANATHLPKNLETVANRLRKNAAQLAGYVEKYAHEIRRELESAAKPAKAVKAAPSKKPAKKKPTPAK